MRKTKEKKDKRASLVTAGAFMFGCLALIAIAASASGRKSKKKQEEEDKVFSQMASLKNKTLEELTSLRDKLSDQERFDDAAVVRDVIRRKIREQELKNPKA